MKITPIRTVVITDDLSTSNALKNFQNDNSVIISIIHEITSIYEIIEVVESKRPSLIFLDTLNNNDDLFQLLKNLKLHLPKLIVISSLESDAVKAYKHNAIDFILKPLDINATMTAMYKAIKQLKMEQALNSKNSEIVSNKNNDVAPGFIAIASINKIDILQMSEIMFCKADGKYTVFYTIDDKILMSSKNLGEYAKKLDAEYFFRVHHSYIVNLRYVSKIIKKDGYYCELLNGTKIPVATRRQEGFQKFIQL